MEKKNKNIKEKPKLQKNKIKPKQNKSSTLFSKTEVRRFVTEFVSSWIRGDIIIHFPTAAELSKKSPLSIAFPVDPSVNAELKIKEHYIELLSICAGTKQASKEEQEKAITEVFRILLMFRSANRIEGKIISNDVEKKLKEIEDKVQTTERLLEKITSFLFRGKYKKYGQETKK